MGLQASLTTTPVTVSSSATSFTERPRKADLAGDPTTGTISQRGALTRSSVRSKSTCSLDTTAFCIPIDACATTAVTAVRRPADRPTEPRRDP